MEHSDTYGSKESDIYGAISAVFLLLFFAALGLWIFFKGFYKVSMMALISPYLAIVFCIIGIGFLAYTIRLRSKGR